ncbi:MAG: helix-turn-helix domain-containing protein [Sphingobium sp.]
MTDAAPALVQLLDELARTRGRTVAAFARIRIEAGLTEMEGIVLSAVMRAQRAPTVSQIGRSLGHARQVIQRAADALVARGLVAFEDNPDHKRARLLVPTDAGQAMQRDNDAKGLALAGRLTTGLDGDAVAATARGLGQVRQRLEENLRRIEREADEDPAANA